MRLGPAGLVVPEDGSHVHGVENKGDHYGPCGRLASMYGELWGPGGCTREGWVCACACAWACMWF